MQAEQERLQVVARAERERLQVEREIEERRIQAEQDRIQTWRRRSEIVYRRSATRIVNVSRP